MVQLTLEQALELAIQHHKAGRLAEAEQVYRQILIYQPQHVEALHFLGVIAYQAGWPDAAVDLIRKALAFNPDAAEAHSNLGNALRASGQLEEATFGCLNDFCKVNESVVGVWAKILSAVPRSQLVLHAHEGSHRQRVLEQLQREGIDPSRIHFLPRVSTEAYFQQYQAIDIALDTFPFAGGTTTCDALWMGVPVVSLAGERAVGRGGLSILTNVGLPELVTSDRERYAQIAIHLAADLPRLCNLRSTLRERMRNSPLMNAPRFARNIESAYRRMWRTWCESSPACLK